MRGRPAAKGAKRSGALCDCDLSLLRVRALRSLSPVNLANQRPETGGWACHSAVAICTAYH